MHSRRYSAANGVRGTWGKRCTCFIAIFCRMQARWPCDFVAAFHAARPAAFQHFGRPVLLVNIPVCFQYSQRHTLSPWPDYWCHPLACKSVPASACPAPAFLYTHTSAPHPGNFPPRPANMENHVQAPAVLVDGNHRYSNGNILISSAMPHGFSEVIPIIFSAILQTAFFYKMLARYAREESAAQT